MGVVGALDLDILISTEKKRFFFPATSRRRILSCSIDCRRVKLLQKMVRLVCSSAAAFEFFEAPHRNASPTPERRYHTRKFKRDTSQPPPECRANYLRHKQNVQCLLLPVLDIQSPSSPPQDAYCEGGKRPDFHEFMSTSRFRYHIFSIS